jgi:hypothetical protein
MMLLLLQAVASQVRKQYSLTNVVTPGCSRGLKAYTSIHFLDIFLPPPFLTRNTH